MSVQATARLERASTTTSFTSPAPRAHAGTSRRASAARGSGFAAAAARVCNDRSMLSMLCIRTVAYAAKATPVTAMPTAIVVSRVTRLASDLR